MAQWKKLARRKIVLSSAVVVVAGGGLWWSMPKSDVPVFRGLDWRGERLSVRYESQDRDLLLITRAVPESTYPVWQTAAYYRYDPKKRTLTEVPKTTWDRATGRIIKTGASGRSVARLAPYDGKLFYCPFNAQMEPVPTVGRTVVTMPRESLNNTVVAVLSTSGWKRPSLRGGWFSAGGGGYYGQHYVELFRASDRKRIGEPIRIPFTTAQGLDGPCWSEDGKYVVYGTRDHGRLCVIHTEIDSGESAKP